MEGFLHPTSELDTLGPRPARERLHGLQVRRPRCALAALARWRCCRSPPALAAEIWVSNEKDDTLSVIDIDTLEVVRTIADRRAAARHHLLQRLPPALHLRLGQRRGAGDGPGESGEILHDLPSGEDPEQFVLQPDDRHL